MCEEYQFRQCYIPEPIPHKVLSLLLLDCWQREYDKRPYRNFRFRRLDFEERMHRDFIFCEDFKVIIKFVHMRILNSVVLIGITFRRNREIITDFVSCLRPIKRIELRLMDLPDMFFEILSNCASCMSVTNLVLNGTILTDRAIYALRKFLIDSKTLEEISVANCNVSQYNFAILADGVHKSVSLKIFDCSNLLGNYLTLEASKMAHIISSLIWQNKLEVLKINYCQFLGHDMEIISEYLARSNSKLYELEVACNRIGPDGAKHLLRAISFSSTLTRLDMSRNGLGTHGGEIVAKYLSSCFQLQYLNIETNKIGANAMNLILTTLKKPVSLKFLQIRGNFFNLKSAKILHRLLKSLVLPQETIDVTSRFDGSFNNFRVVPYY